jgi:hypothetical protein
MAHGARERLGADVAVSVTGIAGPDGGSAEKPVGLVYLHAEGPEGGVGREFSFPGDRASIRARSVVGALHLLRRLLAQSPEVLYDARYRERRSTMRLFLALQLPEPVSAGSKRQASTCAASASSRAATCMSRLPSSAHGPPARSRPSSASCGRLRRTPGRICDSPRPATGRPGAWRCSS